MLRALLLALLLPSSTGAPDVVLYDIYATQILRLDHDLHRFHQITRAPNKGSGEFVFISSLIRGIEALNMEVVAVSTPQDVLGAFRLGAAKGEAPMIIVHPIEQLYRVLKLGIPACNIRVLDFWGLPTIHKSYPKGFLEPSQIWTPWPHQSNAFLGFFLDEISAPPVKATRPYGVVWGKDLSYLSKAPSELWNALKGAGVVLHATVDKMTDLEEKQYGVVNHGIMEPSEFRSLLCKASFLLGLGDPWDGPTALEALSCGTPFLNPYVDVSNQGLDAVRHVDRSTQHRFLQTIGPPHVWNVHLENSSHVLQAIKTVNAAEKSQFVPYEYRKSTFIARLDSLLERRRACAPLHESFSFKQPVTPEENANENEFARIAKEAGVNVTRRGSPARIVEGFPFFMELDVLEMRLHELDSVVDVHILCESKYTQKGDPKPLYFEEHKHEARFAPFLHKIVHIIVEDAPPPGSREGWQNEHLVRNAIARGFAQLPFDPKPDDILIISDVDEIPRREAVEFLRDWGGFPAKIGFAWRWSAYGFFWKITHHWGDEFTTAVTFDFIINTLGNRTQNVRLLIPDWILGLPARFYPDGAPADYGYVAQESAKGVPAGWHCQYCFPPTHYISKGRAVVETPEWSTEQESEERAEKAAIGLRAEGRYVKTIHIGLMKCDDEDESLAYRTLAKREDKHYAPSFALDIGNPHLRYLVDKDFELFKMETKEHLQAADRQSSKLYESGQIEEAVARDMLAAKFLMKVDFANLAQGILQRVVSELPTLESAWQAIVSIAMGSSESAAWAQTLFDGNKGNHMALYYRGVLLETHNHEAACSEAFEQSIAVRPTAKAHLKLGTSYQHQGENTLAVSNYEISAKLLQDLVRLPVDLRLSASAMYGRLGDLHKKQNQPEKATWAYGEALGLNSLDAAIASKLAFQLQGDPSTREQAIEKFRQSLAHRPDDIETSQALQALLAGTGNVICIIANDRPASLQKVLNSLAAATGTHKYDILFFLEPEQSDAIRQVHEIARAYAAKSAASVHVNRQYLGYGANIKQALEAGFNVADFVVILRDDFELATDALVWLEHARLEFAAEEAVLAVATSSDTCQDGVGSAYAAKSARRKALSTGPWGIWRDRYLLHKKQFQWHRSYDLGTFGNSFDKYEVFPLFPRSNAINVTSELSAWAGSKHTEVGIIHFEELSANDIDHVCVSMPNIGSCTRDTMCREHLQGGLKRVVMMQQAQVMQKESILMYQANRLDAGVSRDLLLVDYLVRIEAAAPAKQLLDRVLQVQPNNTRVNEVL
jgi:beta-1,4-mannosyl-glycoprotein beta-1,4-N-acetylglucosaminyltransferase